MTLTRLFWQNTAKTEVETYFFDLASLEAGIEVAKTLQGFSAADCVSVSFSPDGVVLPSGVGSRRRYEYRVKPTKQKVKLAAYKQAGNGLGLGSYLAFTLRVSARRRSASVPAPRHAIIDTAQGVTQAAAAVRRVLGLAWHAPVDVVSWRVIAPRQHQKSFDAATWFNI